MAWRGKSNHLGPKVGRGCSRFFYRVPHNSPPPLAGFHMPATLPCQTQCKRVQGVPESSKPACQAISLISFLVLFPVPLLSHSSLLAVSSNMGSLSPQRLLYIPLFPQRAAWPLGCFWSPQTHSPMETCPCQPTKQCRLPLCDPYLLTLL